MVDSERLEKVLAPIIAWGRWRTDILAIALVGSHARDTAGPRSDVDLILLVSDPETFRRDKTWLGEIAWGNGTIVSQRDADYGSAWSRHVEADNCEFEFTFAGPAWAVTDPIDAGTAHVISGGCRSLIDKTNLFGNLLTARSHV